MSQSPYSSPVAPLAHASEGGRVYTPLQVAFGAALGGPVGLTYFVWRNFHRLSKSGAANQTLLLGLVGLACIVAAESTLSSGLPWLPFAIGYAAIGWLIAMSKQASKPQILASPSLQAQPIWKVIVLGMLFGAVSTLVVFAAGYASGLLGLSA